MHLMPLNCEVKMVKMVSFTLPLPPPKKSTKNKTAPLRRQFIDLPYRALPPE